MNPSSRGTKTRAELIFIVLMIIFQALLLFILNIQYRDETGPGTFSKQIYSRYSQAGRKLVSDAAGFKPMKASEARQTKNEIKEDLKENLKKDYLKALIFYKNKDYEKAYSIFQSLMENDFFTKETAFSWIMSARIYYLAFKGQKNDLKARTIEYLSGNAHRFDPLVFESIIHSNRDLFSTEQIFRLRADFIIKSIITETGEELSAYVKAVMASGTEIKPVSVPVQISASKNICFTALTRDDRRYIYLFRKRNSILEYTVFSEDDFSRGFSAPDREFTELGIKSSCSVKTLDLASGSNSNAMTETSRAVNSKKSGYSALQDFPGLSVSFQFSKSAEEALKRAGFLKNMYIWIISTILLSVILILLRKYLIEQIRLKQMEDNFLNIISHELKTPLASIKLYADSLLTIDDPGAGKEFSRIISSQVTRINLLITNLLYFNRLSTDDFLRAAETACEQIDLHKMVLNSAENYSICFQKDYRLDYNGAQMISADRALMEIIVSNLVENSYKYSQNPVVNILVQADLESISYSDDSCLDFQGDPNELFSRYRQSEKSSNISRGLGLGLYIVKSLSELMKMNVQASRSPEESLLIRLLLPVDQKIKRENK